MDRRRLWSPHDVERNRLTCVATKATNLKIAVTGIECIAERRRILFRVGLNVGDVIVEGHDIFGDGVNIAARLESIAEPGGMCISQSVLNCATR